LLEARRYIRIDANREPGQVAIDLRRELDLFFKDKITEKASA
jgi:hypothetical protein